MLEGVLSRGFAQQFPYLCLWSWMILRQTCVLPDHPRPYRKNLFCIIQGFFVLPEKMLSGLFAPYRLPAKIVWNAEVLVPQRAIMLLIDDRTILDGMVCIE